MGNQKEDTRKQNEPDKARNMERETITIVELLKIIWEQGGG